jgi:hypothetical protein
MNVVYFCPLTKSVETLKTRPVSMEEAIERVKSLFATGVAMFAQVLDDNGLVLENLAPLTLPVMEEAPVPQPHNS